MPLRAKRGSWDPVYAGSGAIPLASIWRIPAYLPFVQPDLTDAAIAGAEARLGVKLPGTYLDLLRIQNGGAVRRGLHPRGNGLVDVIAGIGPRFPSITEHDWTDVKAVMEEAGYDTPARIDDLVAFAGDGHYHYCFDYRRAGRTAEPGVTFIDVETFDADEQLAPDFATFLGQLTFSGCDPVYGIASSAAAAEVAAAFSTATGHFFVDMGDQEGGYRVFRAKLSDDANWAWLTANRAPRGFVRADHPDYATLSERLHGDALREPEHPDCDWFLSCTDFADDVGVALVKSLAGLPYPTRLVRST